MNYDGMILNQTRGEIEFTTLAENRAILTGMIAQARRCIALFTPDLEPRLYDDRLFIQHLQRLAISGRHTSIRILVKDLEHSVKNGHRIIETARRFTSNIKIHRLNEDYDDWPEAFIVIDECGWIWRKLFTLPEGVASFARTLKTRDLLHRFDTGWQNSSPDPEVRTLHI